MRTPSKSEIDRGLHTRCQEVLTASERREPPYALFLSTPRLVALPKATVNVRVVVVGASDTALSFLETLVFRWAWALAPAETPPRRSEPPSPPYAMIAHAVLRICSSAAALRRCGTTT